MKLVSGFGEGWRTSFQFKNGRYMCLHIGAIGYFYHEHGTNHKAWTFWNFARRKK